MAYGKDGSRGSSGGKRGKYLSAVLVVTEMSLAVVLLAGAGLMIRSFLNIYRMQTGVNQKNVLVMRIFLPEAKYPRDEDQISFHDRLKTRLDALPGVLVSSISITMPTGRFSKEYRSRRRRATPSPSSALRVRESRRFRDCCFDSTNPRPVGSPSMGRISAT